MQRTVWILMLMMAMVNCTNVQDDVTGVEEQELYIGDYSASNTNSAQTFINTAKIPVTISAGETVMIGTQGLYQSMFTGDTYLRLSSSNAFLDNLAYNDNFCGTLGSRFAYFAFTTATRWVWAGCSANSSCGLNFVAISRRKDLFSFSTTNTNSATVNTTNRSYFFTGGEVIRASTCSSEAAGALTSGNTWLRLYKSGTEVASNDDATTSCGCGTASLITYTVPASGFYEVRAGCNANTSCSGQVAVYAE